jgi:chromosomal replication initiator protein
MNAANEYWKLVMLDLQSALPLANFLTWFNQLDFVRSTSFGKVITLSTFSKFNQKYIEQKYSVELLTAIQKYYPKAETVNFEISQEKSKVVNKKKEIVDVQSQAIQFDIKQISEPELIKLVKNSLPNKNLNNLNPKYTFNNFTVTQNNQLVANVAKMISDKPGEKYNPVFIHSSTGLGKTHLLQAIGQQTLENYPSFNIKYITSESFMSQYIEAITTKKMKEFNDYYRSVDLLLVDDIQFIAGKEGTQETFFHIFNILHQHNKQIVVTSDKHPKNLGGMESRLASRFEWGIVLDIDKPCYEDKIVIIKNKLNLLHLYLSDIQIESIANCKDLNYRDIEGILNRIQLQSQLLPGQLIEDIELYKIIKGFGATSFVKIDFKSKVQNFEVIFEKVAEAFGIDSTELKGNNRSKNVSNARQLAMYIFRKEMDYSFSSIATIFDKNHSTVMYAVDKIDSKISKNDYMIMQTISKIKTELGNVA